MTRITPACAGKSETESGSCAWPKDHPRMCGEKFPKPVTDIADTGSPPHVRGKVRSSHEVVHINRITPAYAGKRESVLPLIARL